MFENLHIYFLFTNNSFFKISKLPILFNWFACRTFYASQWHDVLTMCYLFDSSNRKERISTCGQYHCPSIFIFGAFISFTPVSRYQWASQCISLLLCHVYAIVVSVFLRLCAYGTYSPTQTHCVELSLRFLSAILSAMPPIMFCRLTFGPNQSNSK